MGCVVKYTCVLVLVYHCYCLCVCVCNLVYTVSYENTAKMMGLLAFKPLFQFVNVFTDFNAFKNKNKNLSVCVC